LLEPSLLAGLLREIAERHHDYELTAPKRDWSDWYAAYISASEHRSTPEEASKAAGLYTEEVRDVLPR
jgi:hypothetical protein